MNNKIESTLAIITAFIVLLSAMWDPRISAAVAIIVLFAFGIYKFLQRDK